MIKILQLIAALPSVVKLIEMIKNIINRSKKGGAVDKKIEELEERVSDLELRVALNEGEVPLPDMGEKE